MDQFISNTKLVKMKALLYGAILGIISLILSIVSLYISKSASSLITSSIINFIVNYVLFLAIAVYFILQLRKLIGGYWSFSTALKNIFIMFAVSTAIGVVGMNLVNMVNPVLQEEAIDNTINLTIETLEGAGSPDEQIDTTIELLEQQKEALGSISIGFVLRGLIISLILYFVLATIFAAIFKKEKLMFQVQANQIDEDQSLNENKEA